ncbi:type IV secretory system conjugative DNA transfer family protein [Thiohalocapsa sp. ML1]|uniref:type IV secretory system conjugative DNA transfer family protein n=1 Tax=Thiohalocapsa sp. ML1 TaxID=1431688 RepID=UPI0012E3B44B
MPPNNGNSGGPLGRARWADPEYIAARYAWREGAIWLGRCPHDPERAIGFDDNRHVFLCAETRSGKGRAFLVNNQVLWPGSLIAIDPKSEAVVTAAARRGPGNDFCEGRVRRSTSSIRAASTCRRNWTASAPTSTRWRRCARTTRGWSRRPAASPTPSARSTRAMPPSGTSVAGSWSPPSSATSSPHRTPRSRTTA